MRSFFLITLFALSLCGCSKSSVPTELKWGVIEVTDGIPIRREMWKGMSCVITPTVQKDGSLLVEMVIEKEGKTLSRPRVQTSSGVPVDFGVDDVSVEFTPNLRK